MGSPETGARCSLARCMIWATPFTCKSPCFLICVTETLLTSFMNWDPLMKELGTQAPGSSVQTLSLLLLCPGFSMLLTRVNISSPEHALEVPPEAPNHHRLCKCRCSGGRRLGLELPPLLAFIFSSFFPSLAHIYFSHLVLRPKIFHSSCALSLGKHLLLS